VLDRLVDVIDDVFERTVPCRFSRLAVDRGEAKSLTAEAQRHTGTESSVVTAIATTLRKKFILNAPPYEDSAALEANILRVSVPLW
jgi:hypothetical protein